MSYTKRSAPERGAAAVAVPFWISRMKPTNEARSARQKKVGEKYRIIYYLIVGSDRNSKNANEKNANVKKIFEKLCK